MVTKRMVTKLSYEIVGCAIKVDKALGPGLLGSVYEQCLKYELEKQGHKVEQQKVVPIVYDDLLMDSSSRFDLLVDNLIVVELKAIETVPSVEEAKLLTYMKLLERPQGLMINFFTDNITKSMKPFVNEFFRELPDE